MTFAERNTLRGEGPGHAGVKMCLFLSWEKGKSADELRYLEVRSRYRGFLDVAPYVRYFKVLVP